MHACNDVSISIHVVTRRAVGVAKAVAFVLLDEYHFSCVIKTKIEYEAVFPFAQEREQGKETVQAVTHKFCESRIEKVAKQREKRVKSQHSPTAIVRKKDHKRVIDAFLV